jgi:photosystem II stability/assembly factor-like uncharacterized protein
MKKSIVGLLLVVLLIGGSLSGCGRSKTAAPATGAAASPTAESQPTATPLSGSWQEIKYLKYFFFIYTAGFATPDTGITVGRDGEVHYTVDGGQTWPEANFSRYCVFGLEIVDAATAWHCGENGDVRFSSDGGKTWQYTGHFGDYEPNQCRYMSFLDGTTGWAASPTVLGMTGDGGKTWTELTLPEGIQKIASIDLRSPSIGYILDSAGTIFTTQDGGKTWSSASLGLASGMTLSIDQAPRSAMRFIDPQQAVIVYTTEDLKLWSAWTEDGGKTWDREQLQKISVFPTVFLTRDGRLLTVNWFLTSEITVLQSLR